ncbi:NADP-dependent 3-hydroxy acid dehydrogenase YdfG [Paenibacillus forsythiae]|uniref:NADP-dependent 3-hydroxy acid dehydrogenase YdfG n=2 Tax=Paenibacillus forsythiae TaxID=365616 RepID=A0ABU3H622_9BACL|nr:NADP-dependent 3-hydroxy acid dehydrogenase YdfG [Paenibacillus forsythiae]
MKIRAIGVSNFHMDRLVDLIIHNEVTPAINQIETHPFLQQVESQSLMQEHNVQIQSWAPFAEGKNDLFQNEVLVSIAKQGRMSPMSNIQDKVVIITGASSGIGEATAKELASKGAKLVLAARREDRLKKMHEEIEKNGGKAVYKVTDVTSSEQMEELAQYALSEFGKIDVMVNNAGLMPLSLLFEKKIKEWDTMVDVNIKGVLYGIAAVLPSMRERKSGHIINVSSIAGHVVGPSTAVYSATKFAVRALTEGLRQEEVANNIRTTIISPGSVTSELTETISGEQLKSMIKEGYKIAIDAENIARAIAYAIEQPNDVAVNEMIIRPTVQQL